MKPMILSIVIIFLSLFQNCKTDDSLEEQKGCTRNVNIGLQAVTPKTATLKRLETKGFLNVEETLATADITKVRILVID